MCLLWCYWCLCLLCMYRKDLWRSDCPPTCHVHSTRGLDFPLCRWVSLKSQTLSKTSIWCVILFLGVCAVMCTALMLCLGQVLDVSCSSGYVFVCSDSTERVWGVSVRCYITVSQQGQCNLQQKRPAFRPHGNSIITTLETVRSGPQSHLLAEQQSYTNPLNSLCVWEREMVTQGSNARSLNWFLSLWYFSASGVLIHFICLLTCAYLVCVCVWGEGLVQ